ncbi:hypothetical protein VNO78_13077 [Psophocarpus tetragonolobus]|uniref:Peptidase A1 domain-containing protein n=1 Tax=Psophocarpus tetragonolobus TaxID=3891 RepID=A0AAN9XPC9_PSOTE
MAIPTSIILLCLLVFIVSPSLASSSASNEFPKSGFISLPVNIDPTTHQYFTSIGIGTPQHNMNLVIDLSENVLWYECDKHYNSSSYKPLSCDSPMCPGGEFLTCSDCNGLHKPGCTNFTCGVSFSNPVSNFGFGGDLGQDFLFIPQIKKPHTHTFFSACAETSRFPGIPILKGLAKGIKGSLGLARNSPFALQSQISSFYNINPPKFSLCLPSSKKGKLFIGGGPTFSAPLHQTEFSTVFSNYEYLFHLNSITINHKRVSFNTTDLLTDIKDNVATRISTLNVHPYTVLHPQLYNPFVKAFVRAAKGKNMKRVKKVEPFGACYDAKTVGDVPQIDLVIESRFGKVNYDISGHDSLVEVRKGVLCLAFVDRGMEALNGVQLGGYQLKDRIFEFDMSNSILRFSSSLVLQNKTCSDPSSL